MSGVPALTPFVAGERVTAAKLNANTVTAFQQTVTGKPFAHMTNTVAQSIATATVTSCLFNTVVSDTDTMANTANFRFDIKTAGVYVITGQMSYASNSTNSRMVSIAKNVSTNLLAQQAVSAIAGVQRMVVVTPPIRMVVGDFITMVTSQNSGAALSTDVTAPGVWMAIEWVAA